MPIGLSLFTGNPRIRRPVEWKNFVFPGGEVSVKLLQHSNLVERFAIRADIHSSDDVMTLLMLTDALRRANRGTDIHLQMPYLPYARQDRVCDVGESLSIKVFCDLINSQNYASVEVWDCHSDVGTALLNNAVNIEQSTLLAEYMSGGISGQRMSDENTVLVSPDAGAQKKIYQVAETYKIKTLAKADKVRDPTNGQILGTTVHSDHVGTKDFLIVDDICDGGRTFTELAKVLRPLTNGRIKLFVTHGIFSKGLEVFDGLIDEVYTANPFPEGLEPYTNLMKAKD